MTEQVVGVVKLHTTIKDVPHKSILNVTSIMDCPQE
jgi:hypothetical protein